MVTSVSPDDFREAMRRFAAHAVLIGQVMDIHVGQATGNLLYVRGDFTTLDRSVTAT